MNRRQVSLVLLALLPASGGVLCAQEDREPRADASEIGHMAEPPSEPDPAPPEAPPEVPSTTPEPPSEAPPETPPDPPRHAVPVDTPGEPHRQPPSRDRNPPPGEPPSSGGDDGYIPEDSYVESDEASDLSSAPGGSLYSNREPQLGALDLDVRPGRTQVYLDGRYLGVVDQYDGWPEHLVLEPGTYEIVFYLNGYRTLARLVTVYPGMVIDVRDRMEPGPSMRPEEFSGRSMQ